MTNRTFAKSLLTAATLAAAFVAGTAQAATVPADKYGYEFRAGERSTYVDGARSGKADPYTDGARIVAGLDRTGVSAEPSRSPYTDGARQGRFDVFTEGARQGQFDVFTEGANV